MSGLGSVSVRLQSEAEILTELNDALLVVEAENIGKSSDFDFSDKDLNESLKFIENFTNRLYLAINEEPISSELSPIVQQLEVDEKPLKFWMEELRKLLDSIGNSKLNADDLKVLEEVMFILNRQFTQDIQYLYSI